jgi:hypothetical protein
LGIAHPFFEKLEAFGFKILSNLSLQCPVVMEVLFGGTNAGELVRTN